MADVTPTALVVNNSDFDQPAATTDPVLAEHADAIRALGRRVTEDVIEIGDRLAECRRILKEDGNWRAWLESELKLSPQTAGRFIQIYELSRQHSNLEHVDLPVSALYLLAAPSTSEAAKADIFKRVEVGESIGVAEVKSAIEGHKQRRARSAPRKRKTKGEKEAEHAEHLAFVIGSNIRTWAALLDEQPERFAAALDCLLADAECMDNLATLARNPSIRLLLSKVADQLGHDNIGGELARLPELEELRAERRQLEIKATDLESEIDKVETEVSRLKGENTALRTEVRELRRAKSNDGLDIPDFLQRTA
jgi:DUF3102 family protein